VALKWFGSFRRLAWVYRTIRQNCEAAITFWVNFESNDGTLSASTEENTVAALDTHLSVRVVLRLVVVCPNTSLVLIELAVLIGYLNKGAGKVSFFRNKLAAS
jgi:hypothetical protein